MGTQFYGPIQSLIHHEDFGRLASWAAADLITELQRVGLNSGTVVDLGSGSGILARQLVDVGYHVIGVDLSAAMIELAQATTPEAEFRCQSLWSAELPPCVAVTAIGEALNYATDPVAGTDALGLLAGRVHRALVPQGVFLFDVATPGRTGAEPVGHQFHDRERWTLYMRAEERDGDLHRWITVFERRVDGLFSRADEHHVLRLYEPLQVETMLRQAGFDVDERESYRAAPAAGGPPGWRAFLGRRLETQG